MNKILYFFVFSFLLLSFESRGMDEFLQDMNEDEDESLQAFFRGSKTPDAAENKTEDPLTPPLWEPLEGVKKLPSPKKKPSLLKSTNSFSVNSDQLQKVPAVFSQKEAEREHTRIVAEKVEAHLKAKNGDQQYVPRGSTKKQSFYISETSSQKPQKKDTFSGTEEELRSNDDAFEIDTHVFKIPGKPHRPHAPSVTTVSPPRPLERVRSHSKSKINAARPSKRKLGPNSKTPSPKRQKTETPKPTPVQNPRKKPQGQRPTS